MKFKHIIWIWGLLHGSWIFGQFGPQQVISTDTSFPRDTVTADLDGDGDMDIIATSESDNKVVWYQNLDGLGDFSEEKNITLSLAGATGLFASDLDQDGDIDIIATEKSGTKIVWYKNLNGLGTFGSEILVTNQTDRPISVYVADIDGDGDNDIVSASLNDSDVNWYKNIDGHGTFGPKQLIDGLALSVRQVHVADLDGDTDMDVIAAAAGSDEVLWYQNIDGQGNFGPPQVLTNTANSALSVFAVDLDGDSDLDIIATAPSDDEVIWFENLDGQGTFGPKKIAASNLQSVRDVKAADLDNDGDIDVLCAFAHTSTNNTSAIAWIENMNGQGSFATPQIISTELSFARMAYPSDLDNDGDQDVVSTSSSDEKVAWYENLTILGVTDVEALGIKVYPNPVKDVLVIESPFAIQQVTIYNALGSLLKEVTQDIKEIPMAGIPTGLLLIEIKTEKGNVMEKIVKK